MAIPKTGNVSLTSIAGDLGLSPRGLSDRKLRCRAQKYSGNVSINDFRGRQLAIQDTVREQWGYWGATGNWQNYRNWYSGNPVLDNSADYRAGMVGGAEGYFDLMQEHLYRGYGDVGVMAGFTAYVPEDTFHTIRWDQYQPWGNIPSLYFTKLEVVGFSAGYGQGSVSYLYNPISGVSGGSGNTSNTAKFQCLKNFPYVAANFHCIVKSAAIDGEYHEVQISNVRIDKD